MTAEPAQPWPPVPGAPVGPGSSGLPWAARVPVSRVGVRGGGVGVIDGAGRLGLWHASWALDWWVGADDRWHRPGREVAVRQQRLADAPVIETALRVPGGDAVQRVFGLRLPGGGGDHLVVEVENRSRLPFALALVIAPAARVDAAGRAVRIDGRPALAAARPPSRWAAGRSDEELFALVAGGDAVEVDAASYRPAAIAGAASGLALLWPLPHRASLRLLVALEPGAGNPAWTGGEATVEPGHQAPVAARLAPGDSGAATWAANGLAAAPSAERAARGWARQVTARSRAELPDPVIGATLTVARSELLLGAGRDASDPLTTLRALRAAELWGHDDEAAALLAVLAERVSEAPDEVAWAALLAGLASHHRLHREAHLARAAVDTVADAVAVLDRAGRRARRNAPELAAVCAGGLAAAASLLVGAGQPDAAARVAARLAKWREVEAGAAVSVHDVAWPVGVLGSIGADPPGAAGSSGTTAPVSEPSGARVHLLEALRAGTHGRADGWARVRAVAAGASPAGTWADPAVGPLLLTVVRMLLVGELQPTRPDPAASPTLLLGAGGTSGWGRLPVAVYGLPASCGTVSWALRWHGDHPALLWEVEPNQPGSAPPRVVAPGLDACWEARSWRGEGLVTAGAAASRADPRTSGDEPGGTVSFS